MVTYVRSLLGAKLGQKGALFVEYALILAFVLVVGVVFLSDGSIASNIKKIFDGTGTMVEKAAPKS